MASTPAPNEDVLRQLAAGIAAAKAGQRDAARQMLLRVVELDEQNIAAWLWLSSVVEAPEDREVCLENVLTLDPGHVAARRGLEALRRQKAAAPPADLPVAATEPAAPPAPPQPGFLAPHASPAGAILEEDLRGRTVASQPTWIAAAGAPAAAPGFLAAAEGVSAPQPAVSALPEEFRGDYRCPYCAAQTQPADKRCPACGGDLWVRYRRRERVSYWLGIGLAIQGAGVVALVFVISLLLASVAESIKLVNPYQLIPLYLGFSAWPAPAMQPAAFALLPPLRLLGSAIPLLYTLGIFIGMAQRWRLAFYAFMIEAALVLVCAVVALFLPKPGLTVGAVGLGLAALMFFLNWQMEDDFFYHARRLALEMDRDAKTAISLLQRGQFYAGQGMWAMAVVHLQRAAGKMPDKIDPYLALAAASTNMRRFDLAAMALSKARLLDAENQELQRIEAALAQAEASRPAER